MPVPAYPDLIERARHSWRTHRPGLLRIAVAGFLLQAAIQFALFAADADAGSTAVYDDATGTWSIVGAGIGLLATQFLIGLAATGGMVALVGLRARGIATSWPTAAARALRRLAPLTAGALLALTGIAAGLVLLLIPGIFLIGAWFLLPVCVVVDGDGPLRALGRSVRLVRGGWWHLFGALAVVLLAMLAVGVVIGVLANLGVDALGSGPMTRAAGLVITSAPLSLGFEPFLAALMAEAHLAATEPG